MMRNYALSYPNRVKKTLGIPQRKPYFTSKECRLAIDMYILSEKLKADEFQEYSLSYFIANAATEITGQDIKYIYVNTARGSPIRRFCDRWITECWPPPRRSHIGMVKPKQHISKLGNHDPRAFETAHWLSPCSTSSSCEHISDPRNRDRQQGTRILIWLIKFASKAKGHSMNEIRIYRTRRARSFALLRRVFPLCLIPIVPAVALGGFLCLISGDTFVLCILFGISLGISVLWALPWGILELAILVPSKADRETRTKSIAPARLAPLIPDMSSL
jgi:hypothetical protein